jgi:phospholipase A1
MKAAFMKFRSFLPALITFLILNPQAHADMIDALHTDEHQKLREEKRDSLNIFRHNLNYLISGEPDTKVQFSFKVQLITDWDLYFGYTQVGFWDLGIKDSSPFSDINYNPELFYRWYTNNGILKGIDLGAYEHRSNGRDGLASRSWDRSYITARTEFKLVGIDWHWDTKVFYLYNLDDTNLDVRNTLGFSEFSLTAVNIFESFLNDAELQIRILPGGKFDLQHPQGSQEVNFKFRLPITRFNPFLFFQFYNGLNESFLSYDLNRTAYRAGIAL